MAFSVDNHDNGTNATTNLLGFVKPLAYVKVMGYPIIIDIEGRFIGRIYVFGGVII